MQKRHTNRKQYFRELAQTCEKYFLPFVENHLKITPEHRILEIGCGEGGNLSPFSKRGCEVTGVDISAVRIAEAKQFFQEEGLAGRFSCQDIFFGRNWRQIWHYHYSRCDWARDAKKETANNSPKTTESQRFNLCRFSAVANAVWRASANLQQPSCVLVAVCSSVAKKNL